MIVPIPLLMVLAFVGLLVFSGVVLVLGAVKLAELRDREMRRFFEQPPTETPPRKSKLPKARLPLRLLVVNRCLLM